VPSPVFHPENTVEILIFCPERLKITDLGCTFKIKIWFERRDFESEIEL
jgi:hypothetical protein